MYIRPVLRLRWKRLGVRLLKQQTKVKNMTVAVCMANCFRMSHRLSASAIDLIMYCTISSIPALTLPTHVGQNRLGHHLCLDLFHDLSF